MCDVANIVELGAGPDIGRGECGAIDSAVTADLNPITNLHITQMRNSARRAIRIYRIAETVTADAGVRVHLAFATDPTRGLIAELRRHSLKRSA